MITFLKIMQIELEFVNDNIERLETSELKTNSALRVIA